MKRLGKVMLWLLALNAISWVVGSIITKRLTRGDEDSNEFSIGAVMGGKKFTSRAKALRNAEVVAALGGVDIDLRDAELDPAGAKLRLKTTMGGARIIVPDNWVIDLTSVGTESHVDLATTPPDELPVDAPHLVIEADTRLGGAQIITKPEIGVA